jgi:hypothetical protein
MRRGSGVRGPLLLSTLGAALGCVPPREPAILINETDAPIQVRYAMPLFNGDICALLNEPPDVKPNEDLRSPGWVVPSSLEIDTDKCEARYVLAPGFASRLYHAGYCDDYEEHADQGEAFRPSLEYLVIESRGGVREWRQWEAVAQFKRAWSSGWCFMRFREL